MNPTLQAELPLPDIPVMLADIPDGQPNLLPSSALGEPLRVEIPLWLLSDPSPEEPEILMLFWNKKLVGEKTWTAPVQEDELFMLVTPELLVHGDHQLFYSVEIVSNAYTAYSDVLSVTIDRIPTELPKDNAIRFPEEVINDGVSDRYLKAHDDLLIGEIPAYPDAAPGDKLTLHWYSNPGGENWIEERILALADVGKPLAIAISGADIRESGEGLRYAWYNVQDRAGNPEHRSIPSPLLARATHRGRVLPAPRVEEAEGGASRSILRPSVARQGVTLLIPDSADIGPNEKVEVFWGRPGQPGAYKPTPEAPGSRRYFVPADYVALQTGKQLELYYELTEKETETSPLHTLTVERVENMPTPQSDSIDGGILSLSRLQGDKAIMHSAIWPFIATTQFVKLELYGISAADGSNLLTEVGKKPVTSTEGRVHLGDIPKDKLALYKRNETLRIQGWVSFDAQATWQPMPIIFPLLMA